MSGAVLAKNVSNRDKIYSFIKNGVDKILPEEENLCYSENPSVDIYMVAEKMGIYEISPAPKELISNEHAKIKEKTIYNDQGIPQKKPVIYINDEDTPDEQRFSIAHDIFHLLADDISSSKYRINEKSPIKIFNIYELFLNRINLGKSLSDISKIIANNISEILEKQVSEEKGRIILEKKLIPIYEDFIKSLIFDEKYIEEFKNKYDTSNEIIKNAIFEATLETFNEEIADYFAANLLVPTERFILWEDKSDKEIALAFGVPENCIKKRREEIEYELDFLTPKNLSSDIIIEEHAPLSIDELNIILEGHCNHEGQA